MLNILKPPLMFCSRDENYLYIRLILSMLASKTCSSIFSNYKVDVKCKKSTWHQNSKIEG